VYVENNTSSTLATILISTSYLVSGVISAIYLYKKLGFILPNKSMHKSIYLLKSGKSLFVGGLSVLLYRSSNTLLLTALSASPLAISTYVIAEKYIKIIQALSMPVTQIFTVRLINELSEGNQNRKLIFRILWNNSKYQIYLISIIILFMFIIYFIDLIKLEYIISNEAETLFIIMLPAVIFGIINYMYGTVAFVSLGFEHLYAKLMLSVGLVAIVTSTILIGAISEIGAAIAYMVAEMLFMITIILVLSSKHK
jgi:PST family polysaccharide transporter